MISFDKSIFFYEPYPHCVVQNFLESSFYEEICKEYPEHKFFNKMDEKNLNEKKFEKYNFGNTAKNNTNFYKFISTTKAIREFYNYLNSDEFSKSLNSFLINNHIDLRLKISKKSKITKMINNLLKRKNKLDFEFSSIPIKDGLILPHTDGGNKLIGFVIPIIDNDEILKAKNIGTKILKAKSNEYKFNYFNKTVPLDNTELIRELPFEKNQMSIHIKTFNSLHGVGPINCNEIKKNLFRKSISIFLLN